MRHAPFLATLAVVGAACGDAATEPFPPPRPVTSAAPSGIPVAVTRAPVDGRANPRRDLSVTVVGDSVIFTHVADEDCGHVYEATAGLVDRTLVVTDVGRVPASTDACNLAAISGGVPVRIAVQAPTRGLLPVVLRTRIGLVPDRLGMHEYELLRRLVVIR
jgi:hypothetical protein